MRWTVIPCLFVMGALGCDDDDGGGAAQPVDAAPPAPDAAPPQPDAAPEDPNTATLAHTFGSYALEPFDEVQPCVIWKLNNEKAIYVNRVSVGNDGSWHHSNWFVVPDDLYPGPDGYFRCRDREFEELKSAVSGSVLFAQSTQSVIEEQVFGPGAVVKIPPNHSVVAGAHMLNLSDRAVETELRMELGLIHPKDVTAVLSAFRLSYFDLNIPAGGEARFTGECDFSRALDGGALKLHWVLPHYHYLGNHFRLELLGGPADGTNLYALDGFNADANGAAFDPPVPLGEATGVRFTCGYRNPTDAAVGWGIGDQEMCVMLALVEADTLMDASVEVTATTEMRGGVPVSTGECNVLSVPKHAAQGPPTDEEKAAELYVPDTAAGDRGIKPAPDCVDTPADAVAEGPATLTAVRAGVFLPRCSFSSCHGGGAGSRAGLDLQAEDLHAELLGHTVEGATDLPLIEPGDPDGSYLYRLVSRCEPVPGDAAVSHMPLNAPRLMPADHVALIRDWIAAGADDD